MTNPVLIVPAAGAGSRLKSADPKPFVPVAGRAMLDRLVDLYRPWVSRIVVAAAPSFADRTRSWAERTGHVEVVEQASPTGMLDAALLAIPAVQRLSPSWVWITWCDQVGVLPATIARLRQLSADTADARLIMPTVITKDPYIHFRRGRDGRILEILQRREGEPVPASGESDIGLFALSFDSYAADLPEYARSAEAGRATGERNLLPFVPWLATRGPVVTFPCTDPMEAVGINTPEDLQRVEQWLLARDRR